MSYHFARHWGIIIILVLLLVLGVRTNSLAFPGAEQVIFSEDFEGDFPGETWTLYDWDGDDFERVWGVTTDRAHAGSGSAWPHAGGADALTPGLNEYPANAYSQIYAGPFSLENTTTATLQFSLYYDTEIGNDSLVVYVSPDGSNYYGTTYSGSTNNEWKTITLNVDEYIGTSTFYISLMFFSNNQVSGPGVWVDDIILRATPKPENTATPTPTLVAPLNEQVFLPMTLRPHLPGENSFEVTQGIQRPDNGVALVANRKTYVRYSLKSNASVSGVSAKLYGFRNGAPLPGSPVDAINNPLTVDAVVDRSLLNETFNFLLPASWTNGTIELYGEASNGGSFSSTSERQAVVFTSVPDLNVTVVPISWQCTNTSKTVLPASENNYAYLVDFTRRVYPVADIHVNAHPAVNYSGSCSGDRAVVSLGDWVNLLNLVTNLWVGEGRPNSYYYGLVALDRCSFCILGAGWLGNYKAAVGFDGFSGPDHEGASETHAHEVGHNHGRYHAPGCGAGNDDPQFPYVLNGKSVIGNPAFPNFGFDLGNLAIYPFSNYMEIMSYCDPTWISDYTYLAIMKYAKTHNTQLLSTQTSTPTLLVSGTLEADGAVKLDSLFSLPANPFQPGPGAYRLELLNAQGQPLATYPFEPAQTVDEGSGVITGFHLGVPQPADLFEVRIWRGSNLLVSRRAGSSVPMVVEASSAVALNADGQTYTLEWQGIDADGDSLSYVVRTSTDGGVTWQILAYNTPSSSLSLSTADFAGKTVQVQVFASDGLHTSSQIFPAVTIP